MNRAIRVFLKSGFGEGKKECGSLLSNTKNALTGQHHHTLLKVGIGFIVSAKEKEDHGQT
jgi:hypothetical protein